MPRTVDDPIATEGTWELESQLRARRLRRELVQSRRGCASGSWGVVGLCRHCAAGATGLCASRARAFVSEKKVGMGKVPSSDSKSTLYCSFCGKSQHDVRKLIAGPTVFICDECIALCK